MSRLLHIVIVVVAICAPASMSAQENDVSLGDLARSVRRSKPPEERDVIDNDNLSLMMDKAETERLEGKPIFAVSPSGKTFTAISPDGTCSLSFDAKNLTRIPVAYIATDLPQDELLKLDGPAAIQDGTLQVSVHNGTRWELREIVVGITVLQPQSGPEYRPAMLESAPTSAEKLPDLTVLYHLKAVGAPDSITVFRGPLGGTFSQSNDWHWSIVAARGIPPAGPATPVPQPATPTIFPVAPPMSEGPQPSATVQLTPQSSTTSLEPATTTTNSDQH